MNQRIQRIREFIQYDLWRQPDMTVYDPKKRIWYRILQTIILVGRGFKDKALNVRANSLSFSLLFAFVPMVAGVFAIARGFGFEELLKERVSSSFLAEANIAPTMIEWVERYLETARDGLFLGIGLIVLIWAVYAFFNMLERSFNTIWDVKQSRSFGRRLTNYMVVLLLVPITIILTSGISIFLNSMATLSPVWQAIEPIRRLLLLRLVPFVVASGVFTWIFFAIPNTKVRFVSAVIPGVLMGILFQVVQMFSVYLVVLFTRMSVVYGAFSAIPLILIWLHITCWLLLVGAELAFAIQNNELFAYEKDLQTMSRRYKDYVMLYLLSLIVKRFEQGERPQTAQEMAAQNQLPIRLVHQLLTRLEDTNILHRVSAEQEDEAFVPAMDTHIITVEMVIGRISAQGTEDFLQHTPKEMQAFWQRYLQMCENNTSDNIRVGEL